ncbi:MAG: hypothetical protein K6T86_12140 [Pirellulales bacterium]|jgi:hypothetical protein|nr:hypothetical protein [Pirellulales bacterium]
MIAPRLYVQLDGGRRVYHPGERLSGSYWLESSTQLEPTAVEVSILWHTFGKGDEDLAVHYFDRRTLAPHELPSLLEHPQRFASVLPPSPLSYEGVIVKIRWCVRVRVFFRKGKDLMAECAFQLGDVPAARAVLPAERD